MDSFVIIVFLFALLAPILAIILFKQRKKHKTAIDSLTANNMAISSQLNESQEKLAQTIRDLYEIYPSLKGEPLHYGNMKNCTVQLLKQRKK